MTVLLGQRYTKMSTEDQNRSVVTARKSADVDALMDDITSGRLLGRKIEMHNEKNDSISNFDVVLTMDECEILKSDPRVYDVRYGSKEENGYILGKNTLDVTRSYSKSGSTLSTDYNWTFPACLSETNPYPANSTALNYQFPYTAIGSGVDVVISDSGIQSDHPEWLDPTGTFSRLQMINWPNSSGYSGIYTQTSDFYTDQDGHGTHVTGSAVGRLYGWAKAANIYAMKIFDYGAFGTSASINMIRGWHNLKTNGNPTVVNMSWGYSRAMSNIASGVYRGTPWTGTSPVPAYGMLTNPQNFNGSSYSCPIRVSSIDSDLLDCVAAGIIMTSSAGNDSFLADKPGGLDYDNYWRSTTNAITYYHRGSTPAAPVGITCVGAVQAAANTEYKAYFSTCGPRVDIYSPGENIMSSMATGSAEAGGAVTYPLNSSFLAKKLNGTSMASPQVCGLLACLVGNRRHYTPADVTNWLTGTCTKNRMNFTTGSYTDYTSLQGGPNNYLYWPFSSSTVLTQTRV